MSKKHYNQSKGGSRKNAAAPLATNNDKNRQAAAKSGKGGKELLSQFLPWFVPIAVFLLVWIWAAWWQGDVFRMIRENSFFAFDGTLMKFELDKPYGLLWAIGRAMLTLFRYPWLGGAVLSLMLTGSCCLFGYVLKAVTQRIPLQRLSSALTSFSCFVQFLPLLVFTGVLTCQGAGNWYEAESGHVMALPLCVFLCLLLLAGLVRLLVSRIPAAFSLSGRRTAILSFVQLLVAVFTLAAPAFYAQKHLAFVRPLAKEQVAVMNQDWETVINVAHENDELSNRPMAAQYAIALVQTGQIAEKLFDIRLDYDNIYTVGLNGDTATTASTNMYLMECDYHAGLVQTAYHHAMESMAMEGPTLRNLKMLCKSSLLRGEWEAADKYLTILDKVPLEGDFVDTYRPMVGDTAKVNADKEMAMVRLTEPVSDVFENQFVQPTFLGYNAVLMQGRSVNALWNALMVSIYTKTMESFLYRAQPLKGTMPPTSIAEALTLMSGKDPSILQSYSGLQFYQGRMGSFINDTQQYMSSPAERAAHARELFPQYKGFYPYYYFFGNLKATKKSTKKESSNVGVN